MTRKQVATAWSEEAYCDLCGTQISDGKHDGTGGTNFWGAFLRLKRNTEEQVTVRRSLHADCLTIQVDWDFRTEHAFEVCGACAKKALAAIEGLKTV